MPVYCFTGKAIANRLWQLLITIAILFSTIWTLPGNSITGHTPLVFIHTCLTHGKTTPAIPAKYKCFSAAMTQF